MRYRTDLEVVLLDSPGVHSALFGLFLLSLVADVVMWLPKAAFSHGVIRPNSWVAGVYLLESAIGIAALIGAALLWLRRAMTQGADMPVGDPLLEEGLAFKL